MADDEQEGAMGECVPLDSPARHLADVDHAMTPARVYHLERIVAKHSAAIRMKYVEGQVANGGDLFAKPGMIAHALAENIDQTCYLRSAEEQIEGVARGLRDGSLSVDAAAGALERMLRT